MTKIKKCIKCLEDKNESFFEIGRNTCKLCRSKQNKERKARQKREDLVKYKCKEMAQSAYSRVYCKSRDYKKCYRELDEPYGFSDSTDMANYLYDNFYNDIKEILNNDEIPSVDRIDTSKGYTKDNIRILTHKENTLLGVESVKREVKMITPDSTQIIFDSTSDCVEYFGYSRNSSSKVANWIRKCQGGYSAYKLPKGYYFEYANDNIKL